MMECQYIIRHNRGIDRYERYGMFCVQLNNRRYGRVITTTGYFRTTTRRSCSCG